MGKKGKKDPNIQTGRWTNEQHEKFMEGLMTYGKNWKMVEQVVATRTASQVRSHAQKFFYRLDREQRKMKKAEHQPAEEQSEGNSAEHDPHQQSDLCQEQTPQQIISLIRQNSKENKTVNIDNFLDSLRKESSMIEENIKQRKTSEDEPTQIIRLQRKNSQLKLMTNLVESYNNICEPSEKNESFFINMIKKYKRYLLGHRFLDLVDYPCHQEIAQTMEKVEKKERKSSFHLIEDTDENEKLLSTLRSKARPEGYKSSDKSAQNHSDSHTQEVEKPKHGGQEDKEDKPPTIIVTCPEVQVEEPKQPT